MRNLYQEDPGYLDFHLQASFGIAISALLLLTPFAINNLLQNRLVLGAGSLFLVVILALNAWSIKTGKNWRNILHGLLILAMIAVLIVSFKKQGVIAAFWCYPAILSFYCMFPERLAWVANILCLSILMPLGWSVLEPELAIRFLATLFAVSIFSAISLRVTNRYQKSLHDKVVTDPLTGVFNRSLYTITLTQAAEQLKRHDTPMTVLLLDLDHFKVVNDTYGHDAGDRLLTDVGQILDTNTRLSDTVFRIGGEEFLCLLYGSNLRNGKLLADKLRRLIEASTAIPTHTVTTSIGVATLQPGESVADWNRRADDNLYKAKNLGRNRVVG